MEQQKWEKLLGQTELGSDLKNSDSLSVHQAVSPWHVGAPMCAMLWVW